MTRSTPVKLGNLQSGLGNELRDPLVHFLLAGAVIYAVYAVAAPNGEERSASRITVTGGGLGFAGALSEVGVPAHEVPPALLMFNIGVEAGQVVFVVAALAALRRLPLALPEGSWRLAPYTIGSMAAFWTLQRVVAAVSQGA